MNKNPFGRQIQRSKYLVDWKDLATALVKHLDLHEGHWQVLMAFGIHGTNLNFKGGVTPAAIVPVTELGLLKVPTATELSVDASEVNPERRIILPTAGAEVGIH
jgi:hypothetical protein